MTTKVNAVTTKVNSGTTKGSTHVRISLRLASFNQLTDSEVFAVMEMAIDLLSPLWQSDYFRLYDRHCIGIHSSRLADAIEANELLKQSFLFRYDLIGPVGLAKSQRASAIDL